MQNEMADLKKILLQRPQGALSSNTKPNLREQVNSIITRSGLTTVEPSIPPPVPPTPRIEVEKEPDTLMDEVHITSPTSIAHVPPPEVQPVSPPKPKEDPKPNPHQPKIPYPSRLNKTKLLDKTDVQISMFLKILKQIHFDISLMDALTQIPKFTKVLKDLLKDKEKLEELANTPINAECSAILLNKVPEKLEDPGKFLIPCILQDLEVYNSLADSGASINLMPLSIYEKLGVGPLKPTRMTLELANRSVTFPMGRPFLRTARALVDLYEEKLTLRVGNEEVVFYTDKSSRNNSSDIQSVHCINIIDFSRDKPISGSTTFPSDSSPSSPLVETSDSLLKEFTDELALLDPFPPGNEDDKFNPKADLREIKYLLNRDPSTVSSPTTDIDITNPILERFTDEPALLLIIDSTLPEESSKSSEITTLLSSPFGNEDKVFNPGILILGGTQIFNDESNDKDFKMNISSVTLFEEHNFLSLSSDRELLFFLELTVIETLFSFSSENEAKFSIPGYSLQNGFTLSL
ncbi:reverse transcriptase domain-containing protein [Tanacetum coccineum]